MTSEKGPDKPANPAPQNGLTKNMRLLAGVLIVAGVAIALFFGLRAFRSFNQFRGRRPPPETMTIDMIRGWMSVPFLSHAFRVPPDYLYASLGAPPQGNDRRGLSDLNQTYAPGKPGVMLDRAKRAIQLCLDAAAPTPTSGGKPPSPPGPLPCPKPPLPGAILDPTPTIPPTSQP
jgi:hypothetical protein